MEATLEGQTLPSDLPADFQTLHTEYMRKEKVNEAARSAEHKRRSLIMQHKRPGPLTLINQVTFIDPRMNAADVAKAKQACVAARMNTTADRSTASFHIVSDLNDIGQRVSWWVSLRGGFVTTPQYIVSKGVRGPLVAYARATLFARKIWASTSFAEAHPVIHSILTKAVTESGSAWQWFEGSEEEFLNAHRRTRAFRDVLGLVTLAEKAQANMEPKRCPCSCQATCNTEY